MKNLIFDIETTGLSPSRSMIICAGFLDLGSANARQYFAETPADEKNLVQEILKEMEGCDAVVTYNGKRFDLPFVLARAKKYGLADELPLFLSIDVYRLLKRYWQAAPMMKSLSQGNVEEALGLSEKREDEISGSECIELYNEYLRKGKQEAKDKILLHNGDDVRQLAKITEKLSFLPYDEIAFKEGFLIKGEAEGKSTKAAVTSCAFAGAKLCARGTAKANMPAVSACEKNLRFDYEPFTGKFALDLLCEERESMIFADLTALPLKAEAFENLDGFHSGFLRLADSGAVLFRESAVLIRELIKRILFD